MDVFIRRLGHVIVLAVIFEIAKDGFTAEVLGVIDIGSAHHVADVFGSVFPGHRHNHDVAAEIIGPVFPMVFVLSRVMLADLGEEAVGSALLQDRRMRASKVLGGNPKLLRAVFAQVMKKAMEADAAMAPVAENDETVLIYGVKVLKRV